MLFANCTAISPVLMVMLTEVVDEARVLVNLGQTLTRGVSVSSPILLEMAEGRGLDVGPKRDDSLRVACALSHKAVTGVLMPPVPLSEYFRFVCPHKLLVSNASVGEDGRTRHVQLLLFSSKGDIKLAEVLSHASCRFWFV